ncbi:MFS transporter [Streptomyces flavofungini]|uniref:MFS transporter n=1 Tax=Streptomyces flavofungini TaxID=68200 RepID=UPI0025B17907|nr:MFS transporter [Streptomyces flavofungini]WJV50267.1 MFS transporter [Streptomyces flavofungini]
MALATAQFVVVLSTSIVNVALPAVSGGLGLSSGALSWVVNAYVLGFGALLLPGGRCADLFGRRRMFVAGTTVFALASLAAGLAPNAAALIADRAVQGVGAALLAPAALALVLLIFPPGPKPEGGAGLTRATALGVWGAVSGAGGAAGVILGGVLTEWYGWRAVFLVVVPIAVTSLGATILLVPADRPTGGGLDVVGALTSTAGLTALVHALTAEQPLVAAAGLALLAVFADRQRRTRSPLVPPRLLRTGRVAAANLAMTLLGAVWVGVFYFLPLYQQQVLGYSALAAGLTQLPLALTVVAASTLAPRLPGRAGLAAALAALTLGLTLLALARTDGTFAVDLLGPSVLVGAGLGVAFVRLTALATDGVPTAESGLAGGLVNTTRQLGGALGLALLTTLAPTPGDYRTAFTTTALIALLTTVAALTTATSSTHPARRNPS